MPWIEKRAQFYHVDFPQIIVIYYLPLHCLSKGSSPTVTLCRDLATENRLMDELSYLTWKCTRLSGP